MFRISVLGPIEVVRDGQRLPIPAGKTSELLVRLAVDAGAWVSADRLLDDLWGEGAVSTRRNTLQSKIAKLRRALGDSAAIESGDGGYRLLVEVSDVDASVVVEQAAVATRLLETGDDPGAADLSASTLQLYRGELLPAAGGGDWIRPHRARLDAARIELIETQFAARSGLGDLGAVIAGVEAAVVEYPFQEGLWELLITALYRAGRQADALAASQRVRSRLAEELGLDPGPRLQDLEQQILVHDESLGAPERAARPFDAAAPAGNLPTVAAPLVGREEEMTALADLLAAGRLVEIVGPGGIGKTALAIAAGRAMTRSERVGRGGVWLARLEAATTPAEVSDVVLAAMNVSGGEPALFERLKGTAALIVLDNCEHVVDAAADLAGRLLDAAPALRVLCTSQVPLDVDGELLFELAPLTLTDAVELFTRRASARSGRPRAVEDDAVLDLCRSLDGLPLAIELAAARTRTLSVEEITRRLDDRFRVLHDPTSRKPERRRALNATIRWSYDLLFPDDQRGLWAVAAFAGGATLPAVESVLAALDIPPTAAMDVVGRLANRSLVIVDDDEVPVRYRLLDSIRAFALDELTDAQCTTRALAAHAEWFADAARRSTPGVRSGDQAEHLAFVRAERANIDAALTWYAEWDPPRALDIVNGFGWAWVVLGDSRGAQRIRAALDAVGETAPARDRATALLLAAWIEASLGDLDLAEAHVAVAAELADRIGDVDLQARACYYLAYVVSHRGEFRDALALTDRSNARYEGLDRPWDQAANWLFAARAAISAGDVERALAARDQVRRWLAVIDDPWLQVRGEAMLGELARIQHRFDDAVVHLERAATASRERGYLQTEAYQVSCLGRAQCQAGDYETGAATLAAAIEKAEATGDPRLAALARVHLGRVLRALGEVASARAALEAATAWHHAVGGGEQALLGECLLAAIDHEEGRPGTAERLTAIQQHAEAEDAAHVEVFARDALARIAAEAGDVTAAQQHLQAADRRMAAASSFISERDRTDKRAVPLPA